MSTTTLHHECPKCHEPMRYEPEQTTDGPHGLTVVQLQPASWSCDRCEYWERAECDNNRRRSALPAD